MHGVFRLKELWFSILASFFCRRRISFTSLDAAASERQSLGAFSNSLMCFGDETRVSRLFGVRTTKGSPWAFSHQFRRAWSLPVTGLDEGVGWKPYFLVATAYKGWSEKCEEPTFEVSDKLAENESRYESHCDHSNTESWKSHVERVLKHFVLGWKVFWTRFCTNSRELRAYR